MSDKEVGNTKDCVCVCMEKDSEKGSFEWSTKLLMEGLWMNVDYEYCSAEEGRY